MDKVSIEHKWETIHDLSNSTIFNDLEWPLTRISSQHFFEVKYQKNKDKVTIAQEETIPNIWNGTMFGDLDNL